MALILGIDIGTTSTIGILIDDEGRTLALAQRPVDLCSERPGWAEEDPGQWWDNTCAIVHELLATAGGRSARTIVLSPRLIVRESSMRRP